jgi:hypothetical protein
MKDPGPSAAVRRGTVGITALLATLFGLSGCASYTQQALGVRDPLARGDLEAAQVFLEEEKPGGDGLPYLMELGLVLRYRGEYVRSNEVFERAEQVIDELYTKSISREALSLAMNEELILYDGEMWERVLIHYYRALNYVELGQFEDALVECRKVNHKLAVYVDSSDNPPTYRTDAFAQYLTAILYEASGELNDAWVSLRLADEAYAHYAEAYGVDQPESLTGDLLRLAHDQGDRDVFEQLRERFPDSPFQDTQALLHQGEIVLFYEEGFIPAKIQHDITIPILKDEYSDDHDDLAHELSTRAHGNYTYKKTELEYLLRVALPAFPPPVPGEGVGWATMSTGGLESRTELAENLDAIARRGLDDRMGGIIFKTILRGLTKYALTRAADEKDAGWLANLFTAATEKADTRGWITLPQTIQIGRLVVDPGVHDLEVRCYWPSGELLETLVFEGVEVGAGQVQILSHRVF